MSARSAGIVNGDGSNKFNPDIYISGANAQAVISRTLNYVGQENQFFDFSTGDFSYMLTPYTIRADIAKAFNALRSKMSTSATFTANVLLDGKIMDWPMPNIDGSNYVPLEVLQQIFPIQEVPDEQCAEKTADGLSNDSIQDVTLVPEAGGQDTSNQKGISNPLANQSAHLPIPMQYTNWVFLSDISLQNGIIMTVNVPSFKYQDIRYVALSSVAELLNMDTQWSEENKAIELRRVFR